MRDSRSTTVDNDPVLEARRYVKNAKDLLLPDFDSLENTIL